jgi:hypothetical protein
MLIGVVPHCLCCGADIGRDTFPHYCDVCVSSIRSTGGLPSDVLEQLKLRIGDPDGG